MFAQKSMKKIIFWFIKKIVSFSDDGNGWKLTGFYFIFHGMSHDIKY